jgi:hypothetical protein
VVHRRPRRERLVGAQLRALADRIVRRRGLSPIRQWKWGTRPDHRWAFVPSCASQKFCRFATTHFEFSCLSRSLLRISRNISPDVISAGRNRDVKKLIVNSVLCRVAYPITVGNSHNWPVLVKRTGKGTGLFFACLIPFGTQDWRL